MHVINYINNELSTAAVVYIHNNNSHSITTECFHRKFIPRGTRDKCEYILRPLHYTHTTYICELTRLQFDLSCQNHKIVSIKE